MSNSNSKKGLGSYNHSIFWPAAILYAIIIAFAITSPTLTGSTFISIRTVILNNLDWVIQISAAAAIVACAVLACGRWGHVKLGNEDVKPEFSFYAWVAMLFCTGLGTGFVIFGSAEPIIHLFTGPTVLEAGTAGKGEGLTEAIRLAVVNWGLLGFPLFAIGGWAIGYAAIRYNKPYRTSTGLYGILGEKCNDTVISKIVDILACIATIGGVSMMIGLGVASISFACSFLFNIHLTDTAKIFIMLGIIIAYIVSASSGLSKGIKILSESTGYLAFILLFAVLLLSATPITFMMSLLLEVTGEFIWRIPQTLFWLDAGTIGEGKSTWAQDWPVFFILWNASYIAFTGGIVARISRGRTLKQFMIGVSITPIILCLIWFAIWGANSGYLQLTGVIDVYSFVQQNPEQALYTVLDTFPLGGALCFLAFITFILFAVTTANSASYFLAQQTTDGHDAPALLNCVFWGVIIGLTGILFQLIGGFNAIRALAIVAASPFVFVTFAYIYSIFKMMEVDHPKVPK